MVDHIEKPEREQDRNILNGQWGKVEKVKGGRWEQGNTTKVEVQQQGV